MNILCNEDNNPDDNNQKNKIYDVVIFCGGKSGGTTLATTFTKNGYKTTHFHLLNTKGMFCSDIDSNDLLEVIRTSSHEKKIYIIDSYRTPIERKISSFFQDINTYVPNYSTLSVKEIIDIFNTTYLNVLENYHSMDEILTHYNIPLFQTFNFKKRYNIVEKENKTFIKILFRDIKEWDAILSKIFGSIITIYSDNLTSEKKDIALLYDLFKSEYKVPQTYLENVLIHESQFKIYNTTKCQAEYIKYWSERSISF